MPAHLKHPNVRQRRNKVSTEAELALSPLESKTPLPGHRSDWLPQVRAAWKKIWDSPMAAEFCEEDAILLAVAFEALQSFYTKPSVLAGKVVMGIFSPFGITPLDRRRLNWTFKVPEPKPKNQPLVARSGDDPRDLLDKIH